MALIGVKTMNNYTINLVFWNIYGFSPNTIWLFFPNFEKRNL